MGLVLRLCSERSYTTSAGAVSSQPELCIGTRSGMGRTDVGLVGGQRHVDLVLPDLARDAEVDERLVLLLRAPAKRTQRQ